MTKNNNELAVMADKLLRMLEQHPGIEVEELAFMLKVLIEGNLIINVRGALYVTPRNFKWGVVKKP